MKWMRILAAMTMIVAVTLGTPGCKEKGPGEKAGEALDKAADDAGDAIEDIGDDLKKSVDK